MVHVHVVTQFRRGTPWPKGHEEKRALELAGRMGHNAGRLRVMQIDPPQAEFRPQRVKT